MVRDDDADLGDHDAFLRALRAPGTTAELADEARFTAAFRASRSRGSLGRFAGRFGIGATTVVTTIALSGGVAAAYTNSLPDPVQRFAHGVLGPVGVPAAPPERPEVREPTPTPTPTSSPEPGAAPTPAPTPEGPGSAVTPAPTPAPTSPVVVAPGTPPSPEPSAGPSAPPRRAATALSAAVSSSRVTYGTAVTVSGVLTAEDGLPLRNRIVRLGGRTSGQPWTRFAVGRTDANGRVNLTSTPLTQNTNLRLSTPQGLRSTVTRVLVVPVLQASTTAADGVTSITVTSQGGRAGDRVVAYRRQADGLVKVGAGTLDAGGSATLTVRTPGRLVRIVLRLPATGVHARAQTALAIGQRAQAAATDPAATDPAPTDPAPTDPGRSEP